MTTSMPRPDFWQGRRVLITGHTGFMGSWLSVWLKKLGAHVCGIALAPDSEPNLFSTAEVEEGVQHHIQDIRDADSVARIVAGFAPEVVFHLAAQALVRPRYVKPLDTFSSNVLGTANVLNAIVATNSVRSCIAATTDKVYRNNETGKAFSEDDPLGGHDPYSASKAACEMVIESYRKSFFTQQDIGLTSVRAGNVIGGGDWATDRLIPDAIRAWTQGSKLEVRNPDAVRPWQHVLAPLSGYLKLAELHFDSAPEEEAYNFGPDSNDIHSVRHVVERALADFGQGEIDYLKKSDGPHEASLLYLDNSKSKKHLNVLPRWKTDEAINLTMNWYKRFYDGASARDLCLSDICSFEAAQ